MGVLARYERKYRRRSRTADPSKVRSTRPRSYENAQHTLRQPRARALLAWDEWVQREIVLRPPIVGADPVDRFAVAARAHDGLKSFAERISYDGVAALETLAAYDAGHGRGGPKRFVPRG